MHNASVAQLVEHLIENQGVVGSSPTLCTKIQGASHGCRWRFASIRVRFDSV